MEPRGRGPDGRGRRYRPHLRPRAAERRALANEQLSAQIGATSTRVAATAPQAWQTCRGHTRLRRGEPQRLCAERSRAGCCGQPALRAAGERAASRPPDAVLRKIGRDPKTPLPQMPRPAPPARPGSTARGARAGPGGRGPQRQNILFACLPAARQRRIVPKRRTSPAAWVLRGATNREGNQ